MEFNDPKKGFTIDNVMELDSVNIVGNFAFVTSSKLGFVKIYELSASSATLVSTLDVNTVKPWLNDTVADWTPSKVHSSPVFPNRIVVETKTILLLLGFSMNDLRVYFFSSLKLAGNLDDHTYSRTIQFHGNYLVVLEGTYLELKVAEYSLANPYKMQLTHMVPVDRDLTPIFPIVSSYSTNSRLFYILMNNEKSGEIFLYAVRFGVASIDSVYKVFKLVSTQGTSENYRLSAASLGPVDWVLLTDKA